MYIVVGETSSSREMKGNGAKEYELSSSLSKMKRNNTIESGSFSSLLKMREGEESEGT